MSKTLHRNLEAKLAALNGPEWDSSDEEAPSTSEPIVKKKALPINNKKSKLLNRQAAPEAIKESDASRVVYLGHIPRGFEEAELSAFLGQFGKVTKLRLSRSKKTANTRGYAFVEFVSQEVAAIVAETMSGYLIDSKRMVCHVLPKDKVHDDMFSGRPFKKVDWAARHRAKVNAPKSSSKMKVITKRLLGRERQKRIKLAEMGIDYVFPGYARSNNEFPSQSDPPREEVAPNTEIEPNPNKKKRKADEEIKDKSLVKSAKHSAKESTVAGKPGKESKETPNITTRVAEKSSTKSSVVKAEKKSLKEAKTPASKSLVAKTKENTAAKTPASDIPTSNKMTPTSTPAPEVKTSTPKSAKSQKTPMPLTTASVLKTPAAKPSKNNKSPVTLTPAPEVKTPIVLPTMAEKSTVANSGDKSKKQKTMAAKESTKSNVVKAEKKSLKEAKTPASKSLVAKTKENTAAKTPASDIPTSNKMTPTSTPAPEVKTSTPKSAKSQKTPMPLTTASVLKTPAAKPSKNNKSPVTLTPAPEVKTPIVLPTMAEKSTVANSGDKSKKQKPPTKKELKMKPVPETKISPKGIGKVENEIPNVLMTKTPASRAKTPSKTKPATVTIVETPETAAVEDNPVKKVTPAKTRSQAKTPAKATPAAKAPASSKKTPQAPTNSFTPPTTRSKKAVAPKTEAKPKAKNTTGKATRRGSN